MTNTELIRQEIERRMSYWWEKLPDADKDTAIWTQDEAKALGEYMAYESLLDFIDSLQQEQPEADLEKAYDAYCKVCGHYHHTTPAHICRQACDYFRDFKALLNARKEK